LRKLVIDKPHKPQTLRSIKLEISALAEHL
jgi:hypothetical protein